MALVKLLRQLPRKRFDFSTWVGTDWAGAKDLSCGTTACALGWATTIPSLQRAGLRLRRHEFGLPYVECNSRADDGAAAEIFGISDEDAASLFYPRFCGPDEIDSGLPDDATPKQVADHIEKFVEQKFGGAKAKAVR